MPVKVRMIEGGRGVAGGAAGANNSEDPKGGGLNVWGLVKFPFTGVTESVCTPWLTAMVPSEPKFTVKENAEKL